MDWLYREAIDLAELSMDELESAGKITLSDEQRENQRMPRHYPVFLLVDLYTAGDALMGSTFQNSVMDQLIPTLRNKAWYHHSTYVRWVWGNTTEGSLVRWLMLDMLVIYPPEAGFQEDSTEYPGEFLLALCNTQFTFGTGRSFGSLMRASYDKCTYHTHEPGQICTFKEQKMPIDDWAKLRDRDPPYASQSR